VLVPIVLATTARLSCVRCSVSDKAVPTNPVVFITALLQELLDERGPLFQECPRKMREQ